MLVLYLDKEPDDKTSISPIIEEEGGTTGNGWQEREEEADGLWEGEGEGEEREGEGEGEDEDEGEGCGNNLKEWER